MNSKLRQLIGIWETRTQDSAMQISISFVGNKPKVEAKDKHDGERFRVSNCAVDGEFLHFSVYVPSMKYRTKNRAWSAGRGRMKLEYTIVEDWRRVGKRK